MKKISNIVTGFTNLVTGRTIPQENKRMSICKKCPSFREDKRCEMCGCYMPAKVKAPKATCPQNKW